MTKKQRQSFKTRLLAAANGRCHYCGAQIDLKTMTRDHVIPLALGGSNCIANQVACCRPCNLAKGARPPHVFINCCMQGLRA